MKSIFNIILLAAAVSAEGPETPAKIPGELAQDIAAATPAAPAEPASTDAQEKLAMFEFDNAKMLYKDDFEAYRKMREEQALGLPDNNCKLAESDNFYGAQQCKFSWECRGARMCERGGWCNGYDACDETPLPLQANGLLPDH